MVTRRQVRCAVCGTVCNRVQIQRPFGERPRYQVLNYVHCASCGWPRDQRGRPLPSAKAAEERRRAAYGWTRVRNPMKVGRPVKKEKTKRSA